jgi:hypothetical protein
MADAVTCPVRVYGVKTLFDDLTTFTRSERNGWHDANTDHVVSKISESGGEYVLESLTGGGIFILKNFFGLGIGRGFELSFDYYVPHKTKIHIYGAEPFVVTKDVQPTGGWAKFRLEYVNGTSAPSIRIHIEQGFPAMDNIRIRQVL